MATLLRSPFFLLFCATSGTGAYLAHRLYVRELKPALIEQWLALVAALQTLGLSYAAYVIRQGSAAARIDPTAATLVAGITGVGIAWMCLECVVGSRDAED